MVTDNAGNPLPRTIDDDFGRTGGLANDEPVQMEKGYEAMRQKLVGHYSWIRKTGSVLWVHNNANK